MSSIMLSKTPTWEVSPSGTDSPHCTIYCSNPTVFRQTDLPPALGPEIMSIRLSLLSVMSRGTTRFPCFSSEIRSKGCIACPQSITAVDCTVGSIAEKVRESAAFAWIKSMLASNWYEWIISSTWGLISFATSVKIRIISRFSSASKLRIRLLASTTSVGSI